MSLLSLSFQTQVEDLRSSVGPKPCGRFHRHILLAPVGDSASTNLDVIPNRRNHPRHIQTCQAGTPWPFRFWARRETGVDLPETPTGGGPSV